MKNDIIQTKTIPFFLFRFFIQCKFKPRLKREKTKKKTTCIFISFIIFQSKMTVLKYQTIHQTNVPVSLLVLPFLFFFFSLNSCSFHVLKHFPLLHLIRSFVYVFLRYYINVHIISLG